MPPRIATFEVDFWEQVKETETCWLWTASVDKWGYGQFGSRTAPPTMLKAHRVSWELVFGCIPNGLCVLHKCDVPRCVRPAHLFLGTVADNNLDMTRKGRNVFQTRNPVLKLGLEEVEEIRALRAAKIPLKELADRFGVRESTISRIANGIRRAG